MSDRNRALEKLFNLASDASVTRELAICASLSADRPGWTIASQRAMMPQTLDLIWGEDIDG